MKESISQKIENILSTDCPNIEKSLENLRDSREVEEDGTTYGLVGVAIDHLKNMQAKLDKARKTMDVDKLSAVAEWEATDTGCLLEALGDLQYVNGNPPLLESVSEVSNQFFRMVHQLDDAIDELPNPAAA